MDILKRKYIVTANLDNGAVDAPKEMEFYNTDEGIANIYLKLIKKNEDGVNTELTSSDLTGYTVTLKAVKPKTMKVRTLDGVINEDIEVNAPIKFELDNEFTNQGGKVRNQLFITKDDKKLTIDEFKYHIKLSIITDLNDEIESNPDKSILEELIEEVKETAQTVNNIDNTNVSDIKTYSNKKIEEKFTDVDSQIKENEKNFNERFETIIPYKNCKKGANIEVSTEADFNILKSLIDEGVSCGVNSFAIIVSHAVKAYTDNAMVGMNSTVTTVLQQVINYCNSINVHVHLRCTIYTLDGHGFQVYPSDVNLWLDNWKNILLQYCSIIYPLGVREVSISNEMRTLTNGNRNKWSEIITSIKSSYPQIEVGINFNIYDYKTDSIYDLFDILGFNFYPCLTKKGINEDIMNLKKGFYYDLYNDRLIPTLIELKNNYTDKKIILTEIGTWSDATSLYQTWKNNYPNEVYDENTQELYYKLIMELLYKNTTILEGMYLFVLVEKTHRLQGYSFLGKKAENIVKKYWLGV